MTFLLLRRAATFLPLCGVLLFSIGTRADGSRAPDEDIQAPPGKAEISDPSEAPAPAPASPRLETTPPGISKAEELRRARRTKRTKKTGTAPTGPENEAEYSDGHADGETDAAFVNSWVWGLVGFGATCGAGVVGALSSGLLPGAGYIGGCGVLAVASGIAALFGGIWPQLNKKKHAGKSESYEDGYKDGAKDRWLNNVIFSLIGSGVAGVISIIAAVAASVFFVVFVLGGSGLALCGSSACAGVSNIPSRANPAAPPLASAPPLVPMETSQGY